MSSPKSEWALAQYSASVHSRIEPPVRLSSGFNHGSANWFGMVGIIDRRAWRSSPPSLKPTGWHQGHHDHGRPPVDCGKDRSDLGVIERGGPALTGPELDELIGQGNAARHADAFYDVLRDPKAIEAWLKARF